MKSDLAVIGGGPAGYTAAIRGAQKGLDVTLVSDGNVGGTCLNHGCIPSKALLTASETVHELETAEEMGIYVEPYVDFSEMIRWKDSIVDRLTGGVEQLCQHNGVELVQGRASFVNSNTVSVSTGTEIQFENAIVATGSKPISLPEFSVSDEPIVDSKGALSMETVPDRLLVIGAGYIGMELSTVFARLGSAVTVIEMREEILPQFQDELTDPLLESVRSLGIDVQFGEAASEWEYVGQDVCVRTDTADGRTAEYSVDTVLVAAGREPLTAGLALDSVDVSTDDRGFMETDEDGRTPVENILAVGDVAGEPMLAHAGSHEATRAVDAIVEDESDGTPVVPSVVYTDPEIATVGLDPAEAEREGLNPIVGRFPFSANGRAMTTRNTEGFVRLVGDSGGQIVGGQVVGPDASELIIEIALSIEQDVTFSELRQVIHTHPSLTEATMGAAEQALGEAIHTMNT